MEKITDEYLQLMIERCNEKKKRHFHFADLIPLNTLLEILEELLCLRTNQKKMIEICGDIKWETDAAILYSDGVTECWHPRSQIEVRELSNGVEITMPEWLAFEKELI